MHKLRRISAMLACVFLAANPAWASSRVWCDAARGAMTAKVIILGKVEEAWNIRVSYRFEGETRTETHRLLRIRVLGAWNGGVKAGDDVFIVDRSDVGHMDEHQPSILLYLTPVDTISGADPAPEHFIWDRDERWAEYRLSYNGAASISLFENQWKPPWRLPVSHRPVPSMSERALFYSIRESFSGDQKENGRATPPLDFEDELNMLDAVFRAPRAADPMTRWRDVLDTSENADLLLYALQQFPAQELPEEDLARLIALMDRLPEGHRALRGVISRFLSGGGAPIPTPLEGQ